MQKPLYKHDCEHCTYVKSGQYGVYTVDWYVCGEDKETVLYRHGNSPSDDGAVNFKGRDDWFKNAYSDFYAVLEEYRNTLK